MAKQSVSNTALGAAVCRCIEQYQPEEIRLFDDAIVEDLLGTPIQVLLRFAGMRKLMVQQTEAVMPGIYGTQICRTRFIDEAVLEALARGIEQVVILGAGLDTRPYRLASMERVRVFEVDLPSVQEQKKKRLQKRYGRLPEQVTFLPIDFDKESLEDRLKGTDFAGAKPAVFVWEGVTQYLSEQAVCQTLSFVGQATVGSVLVFTYVLRSVIEHRSDLPQAGAMIDMMAKRGSPWLFGLEPSCVASYLEPFHLRVLTDWGNAEYQASYLAPLGRKLVVSEAERSVQALVSAH